MAENLALTVIVDDLRSKAKANSSDVQLLKEQLSVKEAEYNAAVEDKEALATTVADLHSKMASAAEANS